MGAMKKLYTDRMLRSNKAVDPSRFLGNLLSSPERRPLNGQPHQGSQQVVADPAVTLGQTSQGDGKLGLVRTATENKRQVGSSSRRPPRAQRGLGGRGGSSERTLFSEA